MLNTAYQLSLFIHSIDIDKSIMPKNNQSWNNNNQVWCVLSIDGSDAPVSTSAVQMLPHSEFNYSVDIQFKPPSSSGCYLFLTLCSFAGESNSDLVALARAKVSIDKLPLNSQHAFRIPLMNRIDSKKKEKNKKKGSTIIKNIKGDEFQQVATILISGIIDPPMSQKHSFD